MWGHSLQEVGIFESDKSMLKSGEVVPLRPRVTEVMRAVHPAVSVSQARGPCNVRPLHAIHALQSLGSAAQVLAFHFGPRLLQGGHNGSANFKDRKLTHSDSQ